MTVSNAVKLPIRLVLLGFFGVVIQESAVSQISIFGVSADLTPLIVMAVGLLCGSLTGAVFGFATGLLIDLILVQTLGVTSLLYIAIGYWSGRLRELRDPSHELVPLAVGAFAAAFAGLGMAVIQFLLGVDAPVSVLLLQQIFVVVLVDTLLALPVYWLVRRILRPVLPEDPRRRRRRAYTTGGLSPLQQGARSAELDHPSQDAMSPLPEDKQLRFVKQEDRSPMSPQLARRVAIVGTMTLAIFAILFFRLWFLQVLSGDQYATAASVNYVRNLEIAAPRGEILDSNGQILAKSQRAYAVEISPPSLPVPLTDKNLAHPPQPDAQLYDRVAGVVGLPTKREKCPWTGTGCSASPRSRARSTRATCSCPTPRPRWRPTSPPSSSGTCRSARARSRA